MATLEDLKNAPDAVDPLAGLKAAPDEIQPTPTPSSNLSVSVQASQGTNPEKAASAKDISDKTGIPPNYILPHLEAHEAIQSANEAGTYQNTSPAVSQWASDPNNAAIAKGDLGNLAQSEQESKAHGVMNDVLDYFKGMPDSVLPAIGHSASGILDMYKTALAPGLHPFDGPLGDPTLAKAYRDGGGGFLGSTNALLTWSGNLAQAGLVTAALPGLLGAEGAVVLGKGALKLAGGLLGIPAGLEITRLNEALHKANVAISGNEPGLTGLARGIAGGVVEQAPVLAFMAHGLKASAPISEEMKTYGDKAFYDSSVAQAERSLTKQRSPQAHSEVMDAIHGGKPVFVDAESMIKAFQAKGLDPVDAFDKMGQLDALSDAKYGSKVKVPLSKWLSSVPPEIQKAVSSDITFDPAHSTANEFEEDRAVVKEPVKGIVDEKGQPIEAQTEPLKGPAGEEAAKMAGEPKEGEMAPPVKKLLDIAMPNLIQNFEKAGMKPEQVARFEAAQNVARTGFASELQEAYKNRMAREEQKWWKDEESRVRPEVEKRVSNLPEYQARKDIEAMPEARLSSKEIASKFPEFKDHPNLRGLTSKDGMSLQDAANLHGFDTGEDLVRGLTDMPSKQEAIDQSVKEEMYSRHGDVEKYLIDTAQNLAFGKTAKGLQDAEFKVIRGEDWTATKGLLRTTAFANKVLGDNARMEVQSAASDMIKRRTVSDIMSSEARAKRDALRFRKESFDAMAKGDIHGAITSKFRDMVNTELAGQAKATAIDLGKDIKFIRDLKPGTDNSKELGTAGADYLDAVNYLRSRYGFSSKGAEGSKAALTRLMDVADKRGDGISLSHLDEPANKYRDTPIEEARELANALRQIKHQADEANGKADQEAFAKLQGIKLEVAAQAKKTLGPNNKPPIPRDEDINLWQSTSDKAAKFKSAFARAINIFSQVDGEQPNGPAMRNFYHPIEDAQNKEFEMREKFSDFAKKELFKYYSTEEFSELRSYKHRVKWTIQDSKGNEIPQFANMTREQMMMAVANAGNSGNYKALSNKYPMEAILSMSENHLESRDLDAVEKMWEHAESYKPLVREQQLRMRGFEPKWVKGEPFKLPMKDGSIREMKGGYFPIKRAKTNPYVPDPNDSASVSKIFENNGGASQYTSDSHTKARTGYGGDLHLNFDAFTDHIGSVIHDLSFHEPLKDLYNQIHDPSISQSIRSVVGDAKYDELDPWIYDLAGTTKKSGDALDPYANALRNGMTASMIGLGVKAGLKHMTMISPLLRSLGPKYTGRAFGMVLNGNMGSMIEMAKTLDPFMAERFGSTGDMGDREIHDYMTRQGYFEEPSKLVKAIYNSAEPMAKETAELVNWTKNQFQKFQSINFGFVRNVDRLKATIGWWGHYTKAMEGNVNQIGQGDSQASVRYARSMVKQIFGSGSQTDLPRVMRGSGVQKLFTPFASMTNNISNNIAKSIREGVYEWRNGSAVDAVSKISSAALLTMVVPAYMISKMSKREKDEPLTVGNIAKMTAWYATEGSLPLGGEAKYAFESKSVRTAALEVPALKILNDGLTSFRYLDGQDKNNGHEAMRAGAEFTGAVLKVPGNDIFNWWDYISKSGTTDLNDPLKFLDKGFSATYKSKSASRYNLFPSP